MADLPLYAGAEYCLQKRSGVLTQKRSSGGVVLLCYSMNRMHFVMKNSSRRHKKFRLNILFIGALLRSGTSDKRLECSSAANEKTQSHMLHFYLDLDQHHR